MLAGAVAPLEPFLRLNLEGIFIGIGCHGSSFDENPVAALRGQTGNCLAGVRLIILYRRRHCRHKESNYDHAVSALATRSSFSVRRTTAAAARTGAVFAWGCRILFIDGTIAADVAAAFGHSCVLRLAAAAAGSVEERGSGNVAGLAGAAGTRRSRCRGSAGAAGAAAAAGILDMATAPTIVAIATADCGTTILGALDHD